MIRGIDHLVIATPDPDAGARQLEERVGLRCTGGGRHEGSGTRNRIAWLAEGAADWRGRPADWPATRYEKKKLAGTPTFLRLRRR